MGLFSWLFGRKKKREQDIEEGISYERNRVDFKQPEERKQYIENCLEQMAEAEKELTLLNGEYSLVTSYLTDIEEIEALPKEQTEEIQVSARKLVALEQERKKYITKTRMSNAEYDKMQAQENEVTEGIEKLTKAEQYQKLIKQDLGKLDSEKSAYDYRSSELYGKLNDCRGMTMIVLITFVICIIMLLILQFVFSYQTIVAFYVLIAAVAVALPVLFFRYLDMEKELERVEKARVRLVQLQNKVKIRYVNNTNLLNYLYMKYSVENAAKLKKLWEEYQSEKEERKQFAEAEAKIDYYREKLLYSLSRYRVKSPERWFRQPQALLDHKEMVEIRHELNTRRQALREQMEYNRQLAARAGDEIRAVAAEYPMYAQEISRMVDEAEQKFDS